MSPKTTPTDSFEIADSGRTVELQKLRTPTGERLTVRGESADIRLDALALESLTWQDDAFFEELTAIAHDGGDAIDASEELQIGNEYTVVRLRKLETTAGPRVAVASPKLGYRCRLSPEELDALTREQIGIFSELLETPFGPEEDHDGVH
jgi:hypothetical protein